MGEHTLSKAARVILRLNCVRVEKALNISTGWYAKRYNPCDNDDRTHRLLELTSAGNRLVYMHSVVHSAMYACTKTARIWEVLAHSSQGRFRT
eukprot:407709-Amphidinium_carterae.1